MGHYIKRLIQILLTIAIVVLGAYESASQGDYDKTLKARDSLFTQGQFVYRDTVIPVLDISYHLWSADGITWRKNYVNGDRYVKLSNDVKNSYGTIDLLEKYWVNSGATIYNNQSYATKVFIDTMGVTTDSKLWVNGNLSATDYYYGNTRMSLTNIYSGTGTDGYVLTKNGDVAQWLPSAGGGGGSTARNVGMGGYGVFEDSLLSELQFRNIASNDTFIDVSLEFATIKLGWDGSGRQVIAGNGLSGGGDLGADRTFNIDIPELTTMPVAVDNNADWFVVNDATDGVHYKVHPNDLWGNPVTMATPFNATGKFIKSTLSSGRAVEQTFLSEDANKHLTIGGRINSTIDFGWSVGIGHEALYSDDKSNNYNVGIGHSALYSTTTGSNNIELGYDAGRFYGPGSLSVNNTTSTYGIFIGASTRPLANGGTNEIVIGKSAVGNGSNTFTFGNTEITDIYTSAKYNGLNGKFSALSGTGNRIAIVDATGLFSATKKDSISYWNTAYADRLKWDGGATGLNAATGRSSLGGTTIGQAMFTSANPSAIRFGRANADNTFSWLTAEDFRTAIGAGTGTGTGVSNQIREGIVTGRNIDLTIADYTLTDRDKLSIKPDASIAVGDTLTISINGGAGIMVHGSPNMTITDNKIYNCGEGIVFQQLNGYAGGLDSARNNIVKRNEFVSTTTGQNMVWARSIRNDFYLYGDIDSNYYVSRIENTTPFATLVDTWSPTYRSMSGWKSYTLLDYNSHLSFTKADSTLFDYYVGDSTKTVALNGTYMLPDSTEITSYQLTPFTGIIAFKDTVPASVIDSIYAAYPLNANLNDSVASQDGTNSGAVVTASGKFQEAYDFDTNTDRIYFPINTGTLTNASYSVSMWVKFDILPSTAGVQYNIFSDVRSGPSFKVDAYVSTTNRITVVTRNTALTTFTTNTGSNTIASTGVWYHIIINIPDVGQSADIYVNGAPASTGTLDAAVTGTGRATDYRFYLGAYTGSTSLDGQIDEFVIRNCWTTATEAEYLYNEGAGRYYPLY